jgi:hypothetical protein
MKRGCGSAEQLPWPQQLLLWAIRAAVHAEPDGAQHLEWVTRTFAWLGVAEALPPIRTLLRALSRSLRFPLTVLGPTHQGVACGEQCLLDFFVESNDCAGPSCKAWASLMPLDDYCLCADAARRAAQVFAGAGLPLVHADPFQIVVRTPPPERLQ